VTFNVCRASQRSPTPTHSLTQSRLGWGPPLLVKPKPKTKMNNLSLRSNFPAFIWSSSFPSFHSHNTQTHPSVLLARHTLPPHILFPPYLFLSYSPYVSSQLFIFYFCLFVIYIYIPFIDSVSYSSFTLFFYLCVLSVVMITTQATQRNVPRL
jgi:hypothetical protein